MRKAYKNIISISVLLSVVSLLMLGDNFLSAGLPGSILAYLLWGSIFTVLYSSVIGISYYVVKRNGSAYAGILTFSILLTAFLFIMDTLVWDVPTTPQPLRKTVFEMLVYGSAYIGIFFGVFSTLFYALDQSIKFIGRLIGINK